MLVLSFFIFKYPSYFLSSIEDYDLLHSCYGMPFKYQTKSNIILGDSRGTASIVPTALGKSYINLSIPGSNFFEGYLTLKKRVKFCKVDTVLCVYGIDFYEATKWTDIRTIPFQLPTTAELHDLIFLEYKNKQLINEKNKLNTPRLLYKQAIRQLKYFHFPLCYANGFKTNFYKLITHQKGSYELQKYYAQLGYYQFGTKSQDSTVSKLGKRFTPNRVNLSYLDSLFSLCTKNKICLYLIIPPINQATANSSSNQSYLKEAGTFLSTKYSNSLLSGIQEMPNTNFGDPTHLNKEGAEFFSKKIKNCISSKKNIPLKTAL